MLMIVDNDHRCRKAMVEALEALGQPTVEVSDGLEALEVLAHARPSLLVTEVLLPRASGYEVCRAAKTRYGPSLPVIFVSRHRTEPADRVAGLMLGADDYVVKPLHLGELVARCRRLLPEPAPRADLPLTLLTPREREVMTLLTEGRGQMEIAERLVITPRTVSKHVEHILVKLGVHNRAQAVAAALREQRPVPGG